MCRERRRSPWNTDHAPVSSACHPLMLGVHDPGSYLRGGPQEKVESHRSGRRGWAIQALIPTIIHQGSPGPCREYRAGGLETCCSGQGTPGWKTPYLVAVGFKGRCTQRVRLGAGNRTSVVTILLSVSLAKCLTTLTGALSLS